MLLTICFIQPVCLSCSLSTLLFLGASLGAFSLRKCWTWNWFGGISSYFKVKHIYPINLKRICASETKVLVSALPNCALCSVNTSGFSQDQVSVCAELSLSALGRDGSGVFFFFSSVLILSPLSAIRNEGCRLHSRDDVAEAFIRNFFK